MTTVGAIAKRAFCNLLTAGQHDMYVNTVLVANSDPTTGCGPFPPTPALAVYRAFCKKREREREKEKRRKRTFVAGSSSRLFRRRMFHAAGLATFSSLLVASSWSPDGRHILNTTEFHLPTLLSASEPPKIAFKKRERGRERNSWQSRIGGSYRVAVCTSISSCPRCSTFGYGGRDVAPTPIDRARNMGVLLDSWLGLEELRLEP
ncbi:WD repeat-containing protein WRAP73, partial [Ophiophagus hannah]